MAQTWLKVTYRLQNNDLRLALEDESVEGQLLGLARTNNPMDQLTARRVFSLESDSTHSSRITY